MFRIQFFIEITIRGEMGFERADPDPPSPAPASETSNGAQRGLMAHRGKGRRRGISQFQRKVLFLLKMRVLREKYQTRGFLTSSILLKSQLKTHGDAIFPLKRMLVCMHLLFGHSAK